MSENEFYDSSQKIIATSSRGIYKYKIKPALIKVVIPLIMIVGAGGYVGKKIGLLSILSHITIKINAENPSSKKITTKSMINSTNQSGGFTAQTVKIDKAFASKEDTQTCANSNCVQGNNYGKMEINQYGPAKMLMTDDQELAVTKAMWLYAGSKFKIIINQMISDQGSSDYAEKLRNALMNAKMDCTQYGNTVIISSPPIPPGISMVVGSDKEYVMDALKNVLEETGFPKELISAKVIETSSDTLEITITPNH